MLIFPAIRIFNWRRAIAGVLWLSGALLLPGSTCRGSDDSVSAATQTTRAGTSEPSVSAAKTKSAALTIQSNPWRKFKDPVPGPAESIGSYAAGCVRGAQKLPDPFPGYVIMRPRRHRYYAHPDLVQFIENLAAQSSAKKLGTLLIGDAGQPRGGPSGSRHASHQTGLDVDIWYWRLPPGRALSLNERNAFQAPVMAVPYFERLTWRWRPDTMNVLELAAQSPRIDRIFVNPVVKREVCKTHAGQPWVAKLRPWWGHDEHFHARLLCPEGNPECRSGAEDAIPPGDGCGTELNEWFTPKKKAEARRKDEHPEPPKMPVLPDACRDLIKP